MERKHRLDEYDKEQINIAIELLTKVYEYHYGDSYMKSEVKRLETIINKLETLKNRCL